jgi:hypothetical protein
MHLVVLILSLIPEDDISEIMELRGVRRAGKFSQVKKMVLLR